MKIMKKHVLILLMFSVILVAWGANPEIDKEGTISSDGKLFKITSNNQMVMTLDYAVDFNSLTVFRLPEGDSHSLIALRNHKTTVESNKITCVSEMINREKVLIGSYTSTAVLDADGRIKVTVKCELLPEQKVNDIYVFFSTKEEIAGYVLRQGNKIPIAAADMKYNNTGAKLSAFFFPENAVMKFSLQPDIYTSFSIIPRTKRIMMTFKDNMVQFIIDFR